MLNSNTIFPSLNILYLLCKFYHEGKRKHYVCYAMKEREKRLHIFLIRMSSITSFDGGEKYCF